MYGSQRSPFLTALLNPGNLAMLALSAAAGLCAAWWLFPLGLLFWLVMFLVIYRDPALTLNNTVESRQTLSQRFQARFERIEKTQISLFNSLNSADPGARQAMQPAQEAINRLVQQTYLICQRMSVLDNHLSLTRANRDPQPELAQVRQRIAATSDAALKQELEQTAQSLQAQDANLTSIAGLLERFEAQLASLSSTLDGVLTNSVRLQALGAQSIRSELPTLLGTIQKQAQEMQDFEQQAAQPQPTAK